MTLHDHAWLKKQVDDIIAMGADDEAAHGEEDYLHRQLIQEHCPEWVNTEIDRLSSADFRRWYA